MSETEEARPTVTFHGTQNEDFALSIAINRNCGCVTGRLGKLDTCQAHHMRDNDQRAVDGLVYARRMAERLLVEEFTTDGKAFLPVDPT